MHGIASNAVWYDDVSIRFLKLVVEHFIVQLTHLINLSFESSTFSSFWTKTLITPIPETSDVRSVNALRAISILPWVSNIIEQISHD
jgi:hypothetical protein